MDNPDEPPIPRDWRGTRISVGSRVIYHRDAEWREGRVVKIRADRASWPYFTLDVAWLADSWDAPSRPHPYDGTQHGIRVYPNSITVWTP